MADLPKRSRPSRNELLEIPGRTNVLFVTVAARLRVPVFANDAVHRALRESWQEAHFWMVGPYVIMPDHIHLFCSPATNPPTRLRDWVKYWKRLISESGVVHTSGPLWLTDCWDTQIRNGRHFSEKWAYMEENPVRAGLVDHPEEWPYRGKMNVLPWRDA